jgi:hypothetical protein
MTTIPGHNQILQQSSIAQELSSQGSALKPSPDHAAVQQQAQEVVKGSTVQDSEESERLKEERGRQKEKGGKKKKKINQDEEMELDPDAPGRLLDTTA